MVSSAVASTISPWSFPSARQFTARGSQARGFIDTMQQPSMLLRGSCPAENEGTLQPNTARTTTARARHVPGKSKPPAQAADHDKWTMLSATDERRSNARTVVA
jgi:hypothetical protein